MKVIAGFLIALSMGCGGEPVDENLFDEELGNVERRAVVSPAANTTSVSSDSKPGGHEWGKILFACNYFPPGDYSRCDPR